LHIEFKDETGHWIRSACTPTNASEQPFADLLQRAKEMQDHNGMQYRVKVPALGWAYYPDDPAPVSTAWCGNGPI
jgi:hypothetical protein